MNVNTYSYFHYVISCSVNSHNDYITQIGGGLETRTLMCFITPVFKTGAIPFDEPSMVSPLF